MNPLGAPCQSVKIGYSICRKIAPLIFRSGWKAMPMGAAAKPSEPGSMPPAPVSDFSPTIVPSLTWKAR